MSTLVRRAVRDGAPLGLLALTLGTRGRPRRLGFAALLGLWSLLYARHRHFGRRETAADHERMRTVTREAYQRHYNERVPTVEEEFEIWTRYHRHRHEMRYDLVAAEVSRRTPGGALVVDVGCGSALVADRLADRRLSYLGVDYGGHHITYAAKKYADHDGPLHVAFVGGAAERLPVRSDTADVVVLSEVVEHLVRPELAVWEIARVLRPGGVLVLTTNNASQLPLVAPTSNPLAWLEKALGFRHPRLISHRPWVWPERVDPDLLPEGAPPVYLPHTWHIAAETGRLLQTAGLHVVSSSTFEFPPPESATAAWLDARGTAGRRAVDVVEAVCRRLPLVDRLGTHLFLVAEKRGGRPAEPPPGVWPGPFSS